jgi:hypothetical protein
MQRLSPLNPRGRQLEAIGLHFSVDRESTWPDSRDVAPSVPHVFSGMQRPYDAGGCYNDYGVKPS